MQKNWKKTSVTRKISMRFLIVGGAILFLVMMGIVFFLLTNRIRENKAIEAIQERKDSPEQLADYLEELERERIRSEAINQELKEMELSADAKIGIRSKELVYYSAPPLSWRDVEKYVEQNGREPIYMEDDLGGFYDEKADESFQTTSDGSDGYESDTVTYFGDFCMEHRYGARTNAQGQTEYHSSCEFYFRGDRIGFDPREYRCTYSGGYLFAVGEKMIYVYDTETEKTISFVQ